MSKIGNNQTCANYFEKLIRGPGPQQSQDEEPTCHGDSGGPVVQVIDNKNSELKVKKRVEIVGITSFRVGCEQNLDFELPRNGPVVYTQVSKYMDWIRKYVSVMYTVNGKIEGRA